MRYKPAARLVDLEKAGVFAVTPRKISAARRALDRLANRDPLFADEVRAGQPTPEERVQYYIEANKRRIAADRKRQADQWLRLRKIRREVPAAVRKAWDEKWSKGSYPGCPYYGLDLMRSILLKHYGLLSGPEIYGCPSNKKWQAAIPGWNL